MDSRKRTWYNIISDDNGLVTVSYVDDIPLKRVTKYPTGNFEWLGDLPRVNCFVGRSTLEVDATK